MKIPCYIFFLSLECVVDGHVGSFQVGTIADSAAMTIPGYVFGAYTPTVLLGLYLEVRLLG